MDDTAEKVLRRTVRDLSYLRQAGKTSRLAKTAIISVLAMAGSVGTSLAQVDVDAGQGVRPQIWCRAGSLGLLAVLQSGSDDNNSLQAAFRRQGQRFVSLGQSYGRVVSVEALGAWGYIGFDDGTIVKLAVTLPMPSLLEPLQNLSAGRAVARALLADHDTKQLYALVNEDLRLVEDNESAEALHEEQTTQMRTDPQPDNASPHGSFLAESQPWQILRFRGSGWQYVASLPDGVSAYHQPAVVARNGWLETVWKDSDGPVRYSRFEDQWSQPLDLPIERAESIWLCILPGELVVVFAQEGSSSQRWRLHLCRRKADQWTAADVLEGPSGPLEVQPGMIDLVGEADRIVGIWREEGRYFSGTWDAGGKPVDGFEDVTTDLTASTLRKNEPSLLGTVLFVAMMVLVLTARGHWVTTPAALPAGWRLSQYWRRAVGFGIDLLPSLTATYIIWRDFLFDPERQSEVLLLIQQGYAVPQVYTIRVFTVVSYAAFCFLTEWLAGSSPGKWAMGTEVRCIEDTTNPPQFAQVLIRNGLKAVEVYFFPLLLFIVSTNRQRLGDIAAGTIVIQKTTET